MTENTAEIIRLLVVSRESALLRLLSAVTDSNSWHAETAATAWDAMERVQSGAAPHLLLLDLPRGESDSLHILRWMRRLRPDLPVIVLCFPEDEVRKSEAVRLGAREVLIRPFDEARLKSAIDAHLIPPENGHANIASEDIEQVGPDSFFVSASPITQKIRAQAELLAEADVPVLILGETGTGKDTVARLIHKLSVRSGFRFFKVNCADMPGELLEAELFGNERTSSQGTCQMGARKFERAHKGTIFLDDITEMPLDLQAKLMRALQEKMFFKAGGDSAISTDMRILAATSTKIEHALAAKKLREDLYYRLSAFTVHVPPLRQRRGEIAVLLQHLMHRLAKHYGLPGRGFSSAVLDACQHYSWPGNLKELETFVKRHLVAGDEELTLSQLESDLVDKTGRTDVSDPHEPGAPQPGESDSKDDQFGSKSLKLLIQTVTWEAERNAIGTALRKTGWNRKAAARLLQISYRTLLYKIDQYHMNSSESFPSPPSDVPSLSGVGSRGKAS